MHVIVDGITYVPADDASARIGVGVTTRNRPDVLSKTLEQIRRYTPGAKLVVVDDASSTPVADADFRFDTQAGIARAKNKCLELLADCQHIFLFDDDCYPITDEWYRPYVDSPEPHLMYIFEDFAAGRKLNDNGVLYADSRHIAYKHPRGCLLYVTREVVTRVGGLDPAFGTWGWEHVEWSDRINAAGLSTWRYADVAGSARSIHSLDENEAVTGVDKHLRTAERLSEGARIYRELSGRYAYVEYRETRDIVISALLTRQTDPQRGTKMRADGALVAAWAKSLAGRDVVLLHDEPLTVPGVELVEVEAVLQPYFARWLHIWQYLREHPEVAHVWATDATDVELLGADPFSPLEPGRLYLGSEPSVVGCKWMRDNHQGQAVSEFIEAYANRPLLNAGLVGGDRETVMSFLAALVRLYFEAAARSESLGMADMGALNLVAWTQYADRLEFGPAINTVFKADERNAWSLWKHK